jgi:hypothetical protein
VVLLWTPCVCAQSPPPPPADDTTASAPAQGFLTRYAFHLSAAAISSSDIRFTAQTLFGGDLDVVDFGSGRATILADYEAIHGNPVRLFEPLQGNYLVEFSAVARTHGVEIGTLFRHMSRHLSDQDLARSIAWNEVAGRLFLRRTLSGWSVWSQTDVGYAIHETFDDYTWMADSNVEARRPLRRHLGTFVDGALHLIGVNGSVPDRGTQTGGRIETGLSVPGHAGAFELFAAWERRIDAWPLGREPYGWLMGGFRFVSR